MRDTSGPADMSVFARFCKHFLPDASGKCWTWTGHATDGYGRMRVSGKMAGAHRLAYELFVGPVPDGMHVLHSCDNRRCVNPAHLRVGTHADNMNDKRLRGRAAGERNPKAKLTERDALAIREMRRRHPPGNRWRGGPGDFLARWFGVSHSSISTVGKCRTWNRKEEDK